MDEPPIPPQLAADFTRNEWEELWVLFTTADDNHSGAIDEDEFRRLLVKMDIQVNDEEIDKLVMEVDTNNNGLIEWDEFVMMVLKAKRGDSRFEKVKSMAQALQMTPVNYLETQAEKFHMTVEFKLVEERKATLYNPKTFVVSVTITIPHDQGSKETYEAIGFSTREAKFKAAELALVKMKKLKPGYEFPPGVIPPEWEKWAFTNLDKGVKATKMLRVLLEKGFAPAKNINFIKRVSLRITTHSLAKEYPLVLTRTGGLPSEWLRWVDEQLSRGFEGSLVLQELQYYGFDETKDIVVAQKLARHKVSENTYDFWSCLSCGNFHEVNLFIIAGQDVNEERMDRHSKIAYTPLQLASKQGFLSIVEFLLQKGANVNAKNSFKRTPLMFAARHAHPAIVKILLKHGASIVDRDNFENTPLHMAAIAGCAQSAREILTFEDSFMRSCIVNINESLNFLDESRSFRGILRGLYNEMMEIKLPSNVHRRFDKIWIHDTVDLAFQKLFKNKQLPVVKPSPEVINRVLDRWKYLQDQCPEGLDDIENKRIEIARASGVHNAIHLQIYIEQMFKEAYKNTPNRQGRTPLHLACEENLVCSHEAVLRVLIDTFGCDVHIRDNLSRTPLDLLLHRKQRPGSPVEDKKYEEGIRASRSTRRLANNASRKALRDAERRAKFDAQLLQTLPRHQETKEIDLTIAKERSRVQATIAGWREYIDPESLNSFYEEIDSGRLQLIMPDAVKEALHKRLIWYKRRTSARILEKRGTWSMHSRHTRVFFYNHETGEYQWNKPERVDGWVNTPPNFQAKSLDESDDSSDEEDERDSQRDIQKREQLHEYSEKFLRRLQDWEEHRDTATGGRLYYHIKSGHITREKPKEVLHEELKRQAYTILTKTAQFIDQIGDWDKYYDAITKHFFFYNRVTGAGQHESEANEAALRAEAEHATKSGKLLHRLSAEELSKRQEQEEWMETLQRARRKEIHTTIARYVGIDEETRRLHELNTAILQKIDEDFAHQTMGYRDARIDTEQRVLQKARNLGLFVSVKITKPIMIATQSALDAAMTLQMDEDESASIEDHDNHPSLSERRRVNRLIENGIWRMDQNMALCFWGCHLWCHLGEEKDNHEHDECRRRIMICRLGCPIYHEAYEWQNVHADTYELAWHEANECSTRLIKCPRDCGAWVSLDQLEIHTNEHCVKRPISDLRCRLGCGKQFDGVNNRILELEQERTWHEAEDCPLRTVKCMWPECNLTMLAKDRKQHRRTHLCMSGIVTFKVAGSFEYVVPRDVKHIKIQAWGGGGGSGILRHFRCGHGGGGAFIEAICPVHPGETLLLVVGGGGQGGQFGQTLPSDTESGLPLIQQLGKGEGGHPGGGCGYSNNNEWACGGGGGYTSMTRKGPQGLITLFVAGGGGGGGCRDGLGGGGLHAEEAGEKSDRRNGRLGSQTRGGKAGQCSKETTPTTFEGTDGSAFQGGNGAEFGGGGGGGYFGGGGGGFSPGIVGAGGGGSSYVDSNSFTSVFIDRSYKRVPGGRDKHPPASAMGGIAGEGGYGTQDTVCAGNDGCIRIAIPGFYSNMDFDSEDDEMRS